MLYRRNDDRVTRGERLLSRVPVALLDYPLEVLLAAWGIISGPPMLLGLAKPTSLSELLPGWGRALWAALLVLASVTIAVGLHRRRYGSTVSRGLELLGTTCLVYAFAILVVIGWRDGIPAGPLLTAIGLLCWFRAWCLVLRARALRRMNLSLDDTWSAVEDGATEGSP